MGSGIRATVEFTTPDVCPVVELATDAGTTVDSVATSVCSGDCTECVTEFAMDAERDPDGAVTHIFSHGSTHRYRRTHGVGATCPCERLGRFGCPVVRYVAEDGTLTVVFYATGYEELRDVVVDLRDRFPSGDVTRLVRSPGGGGSRDRVLVDRSRLTARQREVLETAYEMGYFERPREANATEVAAELGISPSTFGEHLAAAEEKVVADLFEEG